MENQNQTALAGSHDRLSATDIMVAIAYITAAFIFIPLQTLCAYLIYSDKEMKNATYAFMINLCIADCIELLVVGVYAGVVILTKYENPVMGRVAAFLCASAWYANCVLFVLIAFSRWVAITRPHLQSLVFRPRILWFLHAGSWLLMGIPTFYGGILSERNLLSFLTRLYTWVFNDTSELGAAFNWINLVFDTLCTSVEMGFNILSLIWVHTMRKRVQTLSAEENWRREITLLIQCVILGCIFAAAFIAFTVVSAFNLVTLTSCLVMQGVWTFNHCVNPIVYLTVNKRLRKHAIEFVTRRKFSANGSLLMSTGDNYAPVRRLAFSVLRDRNYVN